MTEIHGIRLEDQAELEIRGRLTRLEHRQTQLAWLLLALCAAVGAIGAILTETEAR